MNENEKLNRTRLVAAPMLLGVIALCVVTRISVNIMVYCLGLGLGHFKDLCDNNDAKTAHILLVINLTDKFVAAASK